MAPAITGDLITFQTILFFSSDIFINLAVLVGGFYKDLDSFIENLFIIFNL